MTESVAVVGAGLVGCLVALGLAKKGYKVTLFDGRADPRINHQVGLRSINLAVSERGIRALDYVDSEMSTRVLDGMIPMYGRMIHDLEGNQDSQLYGLFGESINSIDRSKLNVNLVDEIERFNKSATNKIEVKFENKVVGVNFEDGKKSGVVFLDGNQEQQSEVFDFVVGADGSYSVVRQSLQKYVRMTYSQEYIDMCYIELYIPPGPDNKHLIHPNRLHIWPRKDYMLIALANHDGSFTSTFFGPWALAESLKEPEQIETFFRESFPDAMEMIGSERVVDCFLNNPKGALMQVNCSQYHYGDRCIIVGDAAHSMVPFYGQGMNCGFEDVRVLLELMEQSKSRKEAFERYSATRSDDLRAILKLALDNYHEMSTKVISSLYLFRKKLDGVLGRLVPKYWIPLYTMVSFRADIGYAEAIQRERWQQRVLRGVEWVVLGVGLGAIARARRA